MIENWLVVHASIRDKILRGEVETPAVEDARKTKENQGELQNIYREDDRIMYEKFHIL